MRRALLEVPLRRRQEDDRETDCHTSDIGHWFAMTRNERTRGGRSDLGIAPYATGRRVRRGAPLRRGSRAGVFPKSSAVILSVSEGSRPPAQGLFFAPVFRLCAAGIFQLAALCEAMT